MVKEKILTKESKIGIMSLGKIGLLSLVVIDFSKRNFIVIDLIKKKKGKI